MTSVRSIDGKVNKFNIINLLAYGLNVAVTYGIGVAGWFDLPTNSELSLKYQTLVTPVGWAFSIWALIFLSQLVWVIYQIAVPATRSSVWVTSVGYHYLLVCLAQAGWTLSFSTESIELSMVFMALLLLFLSTIVFILNTLRQRRDDSVVSLRDKVMDYIIWQFPFTIHCGWIIAATVVNANVLLVDFGLSDSIQFLAAVAGLVLLFVAALLVLFPRPSDYIVPAVIAFALIGVFTELSSPSDSIEETFSESQIEQTRLSALGASLIILVAVVAQDIRTFREAKVGSASSGTVASEESNYLRAPDAPGR